MCTENNCKNQGINIAAGETNAEKNNLFSDQFYILCAINVHYSLNAYLSSHVRARNKSIQIPAF